MGETRRRLEISLEMMTWISAIPSLLKRIGEAEKLTNLSVTEIQKLRDASRQIARIFERASALLDDDGNDKRIFQQLVASTDKVREEIVKANVILDRLRVPDPE